MTLAFVFNLRVPVVVVTRFGLKTFAPLIPGTVLYTASVRFLVPWPLLRSRGLVRVGFITRTYANSRHVYCQPSR